MDQSLSIAILAYPGSLKSAVYGLQDILGHAARISDTGMKLDLLEDFSAAVDRYDAVVLPPSAGTVRLEEVPALPAFLKHLHGRGAVVCSACTGLTFVAAAGLAEGRKVTTHWGLEQRLSAAYPDLRLDTDRLLIEYSDLITAGGLMAWVDLALALIERFLGYPVAVATARHFIVDFRRRDQRRFRRFLPELRHGDASILKVQHFLETRSGDDVSVADMVRTSGLPARTFQRRFKLATGLAPKQYLQELRIERARDLLIETDRPVSDICFAIGYNDPPSFVRLFSRLSGLTPGAFREQYRRQPDMAG
ncbi:transcriptional regulator [Labrenzia sp. C1B10]|uniref:GlxA family transcriptional regulator n=1 Tax=unclassified Labrenzia TaxID=2648686 RepID=UPI0003B91A81|nr:MULTISPECIES: helix-turn-helix domain-containing protein [unclassified Labrenzia]ERP87816.1 transcriptional regulator [Labrenzia sp. C1B10]ERS08120.1 transcriptional regulator [Labrenzia sp. C1B70]